MSGAVIKGDAPTILTGEVIPPGASSHVVFSDSPFQQRVRRLEAPAGSNIEDVVALCGVGPRLRRHLAVYAGEHKIPQHLWRVVRPRPGTALHVRVELAGGDSDDLLRTVLFIAVVMIGSFLGGLVGGAIGGTLGTVANVAVTVLAITAGQALINALIPPPGSKKDYAFDQQPGNPYASITGLQNRFAPYAPIPRIFGKRRVYPMLAARPYTENEGNRQYLRMLLLVGYGPLRITDIKIGNTPISSFVGAQTEIREGWDDDTDPTLYTRQIEEDDLSILLTPSSSFVQNTEIDAKEASVDITFPGGLVTFDSGNGSKKKRTVEVTVQWRVAGSGGAWTNATWINGRTEWGTNVNGKIICTDSSQQAVIRSGRFAFPAEGEYEVRLTRTTSAGGTYDVDAAYWTKLRSIRPDVPINKAGLCLIALRLKATEQLNGVPDTINCIAESYLPVYDDVAQTWNYEISRNPAWAYADVFRRRGLQTVLADSRLDLDALVDWAADCDATAPNASEATWSFDYVAEGGSIFSTAEMIAAHGRARFDIRDGKYSVVQDKEQSTIVQHISPRNSSDYRGKKAFVDIPHAFKMQFINAAKAYAEDHVYVYRDGYAEEAGGGNLAATKFDTIDLPGCTSETQAWREGRYHFAQLLLRPEEHSVKMDIEAIRCRRGDLVRFSHDVVSIGSGSARIASLVTSGSNITHIVVDNGFDLEDGTTYGIRVRHADFSSSVHVLVTPGGGAAGATSLQLATPTPISGGPAVGDLVQFGVSTLESAPMIVKAIEYAEELSARVVMVDAQAGVYTADQGTIPAFNTYMTRGQPVAQLQPAAPSAITLRSDETVIQRLADGTMIDRVAVDLALPVTSDVPIGRWEVEWRHATGDGEWLPVETANIEKTTIFVPDVVGGEDTVDIRARTISVFGVPSDWVESLAHAVVGKTTAPSPPSGFSATATIDGVYLAWTQSGSLDVVGYEVRYGGANWDAATVVGEFPGPTAWVSITLGGVTTFRVKAIDAVGLYSTEVTADSAATNAGVTRIADGAINVAAFAAGLTPVEIVSSLPGSGNYAGRMAFLTTDNKLYRHNGSSWTAAVPTTDLTGQITTTQITDDAVTTAKINAGAVTAAEIAASTITGDKIAANTITSGLIQAAAIGTTQLAAQSITASKLALIDTTNLIQDRFLAEQAEWNRSHTSEVTFVTGDADCVALDVPTAIQVGAAHPAGGQYRGAWWSRTFPVESGAPYRIRAKTRKSAGFNGRCYVQWAWYDESLAYISSSTAIFGTSHIGSPLGAAANETLNDIRTAPANAAYARPYVYVDWGASYSGSAGYAIFSDYACSRAANAELIVDGTITAAKIAAATITADKLSVSTLSAISANIGTVTSGMIQNVAGTTYFDLTNGRIVCAAGSYHLAQGAGFGASSDLIMWFGPSSVAIGSMTKTNGVWALATDGLVYYGAAELETGGGGGGVKTVVTEDQSTSGTTHVEVSRCELTVASGGRYRIGPFGYSQPGETSMSSGTEWYGAWEVIENSDGGAASSPVVASGDLVISGTGDDLDFDFNVLASGGYVNADVNAAGVRDLTLRVWRVSGSNNVSTFTAGLQIEYIPPIA